MVEDVIINFTIGENEVETGLEKISKTKVDIKGFTELSKNVKAAKGDTAALITEFKKVATTATQMGKSVEAAFEAGVIDALKDADVSVEEFTAALTKANAPAKTLKQELRELKEAIALAKVNGKDFGDEFERMTARAGALADAVQDAGAEIKNAGSDTRNIDNVVGSISALAGGYAAVQGAAALFGEENEDIQKGLLKVNSAMALATGIQQFYTAAQKEGSLAKLYDSIQSKGAAVAQGIYTVAVGTSTGALKAFRVALLLSGIGAVVALLVLAANAMGLFGDATGDATENLKAQKEAADDLVSSLDDIAGASARARASQAGGSDETRRQIELAKAKGASSQQVFSLEQKLRQQELQELKILGKTYQQAYATRQRLGTLTAAEAEVLNEKITETYREALNKQNEINASTFEFQREQANKAAELAEKNAKKKQDDLEKERLKREGFLKDELADLERKMLFVEKFSAEELDLQKKIVDKKKDIELNAAKLSTAQIRLIRARAYDERIKLDEAFNKRATELQLNAQLQTNEAILAGIAIGNEKRLQLQIENIATQAQLEINAAEGNATKILLIEAKKIADIRALKNKAIEDELAQQIAASEKTTAIIKASLDKIVADTKEATAVRIAAAEGIGRQELLNADRAIEANEKKEQSDEDYQANYKKLADERAAIEQSTADKIVEINKSANEQKKLDLQEGVQLAVELGRQASDFFSNLAQLSADRETANIERQKRELAELEEAGAISAKNAEIRAKQIEIQERNAKNRQAQREKQVAVFNALLAIPQAYLAGLKSGPQGLVLGPIFALIAAAQAALVIARPVPKFFRGKQPGTYEGRGVVADMGPEIVERGGRMFLYTKPTETHLGRYDKVHTAAQTRAIMHSTKINTTVAAPVAEKLEIDYNKMPKSNVSINIEKDFIRESVAEGLQMNRYFNNRYKF